MAAALVEARQLGAHDATDVLGVSFSTPDLIGHAFGPDSQEIHDAYAHLDRTLGEFLDRLDQLVGRNQFVVALSADHGVTEVPEQAVKEGKDAGRINAGALASTIESAAQTALGPGRYLARENGNDAYFLPGIYDRLKQTAGALDAIVKAARAVPGIAQVFSAEQVSSPLSTTGALRAASLSYVPQRSGDLVIVPKPGWMFATSGTTHGTSSDDDQRVPIILYGVGVKHGTYSEPATPADVAPTLAALAGITLSHTDGHPLSVALTLPRPHAVHQGRDTTGRLHDTVAMRRDQMSSGRPRNSW
jgi:predicted AlkP superfamily pyrophosphatase or phosphodiesterase